MPQGHGDGLLGQRTGNSRFGPSGAKGDGELSIVNEAASLEGVTGETNGVVRWQSPDGRRLLQLALGAIWLLDGVLQLQPFMFTAGAHGFSGMLNGMATGNPSLVARTITWNASIIDHHAVVTNTAFAFIQILIGFGIAWRPTLKLALGASIVWGLGVWWFGEGLGGVLHGVGTPIGGGPGAVLFYALLAILLWPTDRVASSPPFAAARAVGIRAARAIWVVVWVGLALLSLIGSGRSPQGIHDQIDTLDTGQPGWLAAIDRHAASLVAHRGLVVAIVFAVLCLVVAYGVFLSARPARATLVVAVVTAVVVWVVGENFGLILAGGATDPNSGPVLILLALAYWPIRQRAVPPATSSADAVGWAVPVEVG